MTRQTNRSITVAMPDAVVALNRTDGGTSNFDDWVSLLAILQDIWMPRWADGRRVEPLILSGAPK